MASNIEVPTREAILTELGRVLESRPFREAHHLRALLEYMVVETLEGHQSELKEYSLGVRVLHRNTDYDPRTDAIVRVQASQLRKRLQTLYEQEPGPAGFQIEIPKGGYVPTFPVREPVPLPDVAAREPLPRRRRSLLAAFLAGVVLTACGVAAFQSASWWAGRGQNTAPMLWAPLIAPGGSTIVSFGVPLFYTGSGLYVRDVRINQPGQEIDSGIERVGKAMNQLLRPNEDVYTGIGEAVGTYEVGRFLERLGGRVQIANSRSLGPSDLRARNLVVISSARFQTPLSRFHLPEAFPFVPDKLNGAYGNANPLPGELPAYQTKGGAATGVQSSHATICVWPGVTVKHRLILLSGISSWCTLAAVRYALDPKAQADLEQRLASDPLQGPRGRKGPYYQVLLRVEGRDDQVRFCEYVTHRYLDAQPIRAE